MALHSRKSKPSQCICYNLNIRLTPLIIIFTTCFRRFLYFYCSKKIFNKTQQMVNNLKHSVLAAAVTGICLTSFGQTSTKEPVPNGWHLKDRQTTGYYGISLDKAYDFVKGKKSQTVIVAVIDSGIDTTHE